MTTILLGIIAILSVLVIVWQLIEFASKSQGTMGFKTHAEEAILCIALCSFAAGFALLGLFKPVSAPQDQVTAFVSGLLLIVGLGIFIAFWVYNRKHST